MFDMESNQIKILAVYQMTEGLEAIGRLLVENDFEFHFSDNSEKAFEIIRRTPIDLIILEIGKEEVLGLKLLEDFRDRSETREIPVLIVADEKTIAAMNEMDGYDHVEFIRKPVVSVEFLMRIRNLIQLRKLESDWENKRQQLEEVYMDLRNIRNELDRKKINLEEAYEKIGKLDITDQLTKLLNPAEIRRVMEYEGLRSERTGREFAVISIGIDYFNAIRDQFGLETSDNVLKEAAGLLKSCLRKQDFIARWKDEEVLILLPETNKEGAMVVAEKLRKKILKHSFSIQTNEDKVTITCGIAMYSKYLPIDKLVENAVKALQRGKQEGGNRSVYYK